MVAYETILVAVASASSINKFRYVQNKKNLRCAGISFYVSKSASTTRALAQLGLTFNNQKSPVVINEYLYYNTSSTSRQVPQILDLNVPLDSNNYITGYVQDLNNIAAFAAYNVRIVLKFIRDEQ